MLKHKRNTKETTQDMIAQLLKATEGLSAAVRSQSKHKVHGGTQYVR